jgi:hypothetical protein
MQSRLQNLLWIVVALNLLVGTPAGMVRSTGEREEAPAPDEGACPLGAASRTMRVVHRQRHAPQRHFHSQWRANRHSPVFSSAGQYLPAKSGHELFNGLRAPLLT